MNYHYMRKLFCVNKLSEIKYKHFFSDSSDSLFNHVIMNAKELRRIDDIFRIRLSVGDDRLNCIQKQNSCNRFLSDMRTIIRRLFFGTLFKPIFALFVQQISVS